MKKLEAVIFDYDGTIVNTEKSYFESIKCLLKKHTGQEVEKLDYIRNVSGTSVEQCKNYIMTKYNMSADDYTKLERDIASDMKERIKTAEVLPYIEETFKLLKDNGIKIGVASNGTLDHIIEGLREKELYSYVDDIVTKYDVEKGKPAPDIYLFAAERLGVDIENCVAVEDSRPGALAASASGAHLILQTNDITKYLDFTNVNYKTRDCNLYEEISKFIKN